MDKVDKLDRDPRSYTWVEFEKGYADMPEKYDVLVGDKGIVKPASIKIPHEINGVNAICVNFLSDKTGRGGGDSYWLPVTTLSTTDPPRNE